MAGTVNFDHTIPNPTEGSMRRLVVSWQSDGSGNASRNIPMNGVILRASFSPDATDVPTANYDITALDVAGIDTLMGTGANLSATVPKTVIPLTASGTTGDSSFWPICVADELAFTVANAGANKKGRTIFYYR